MPTRCHYRKKTRGNWGEASKTKHLSTEIYVFQYVFRVFSSFHTPEDSPARAKKKKEKEKEEKSKRTPLTCNHAKRTLLQQTFVGQRIY